MNKGPVQTQKTVIKKKIVKKAAAKKLPEGCRDIGIDVTYPTKVCDDRNCPFHGKLSVRGSIITGVIVSSKMQGTVIVEKKRSYFDTKYQRYETRTGRYFAHKPKCFEGKVGAEVKIMECRPLAKNVSYVVIDEKTGGNK
ncbi:MAG: 30S ribosomal protein S17 [Thermoplasmata archaeon]